MRILITQTFQRTVKKLHPAQKRALDDSVRKIVASPELGEAKVGDLAGVRVHKFRMDKLLCMLAYRIVDQATIKLLMLGPHENFYRDLKKRDE